MPDIDVGQPASGLGLGLHDASSEHGITHEIRTLHSADRFRWGRHAQYGRFAHRSIKTTTTAFLARWVWRRCRRTDSLLPASRRGTVSEQRGSPRVLGLLTTGLIIGAVEVVLAISFASLVFGGY